MRRLRRHYTTSLKMAAEAKLPGSILMVYRRVGGASIVWLPDIRAPYKQAEWALTGAKWRILRRVP